MKAAGHLALAIILNFNVGIMYLFSMYTNDLINLFDMTRPQVTTLGQMLLVGVGSSILPLSIIYDAKWCAGFRDRLLIAVSMVSTCLAFGILIPAHVEARDGVPWSNSVAFPLFIVAFLSFGVTGGSSYAHSVWVLTQVYSEKKAVVVAAITASFGTGPAIYSAVYTHVFTYWKPSNFFLYQFIVFMVLHTARFWWHPRDFEILRPVDDIQTPQLASPEHTCYEVKVEPSWRDFFTDPVVLLSYLCTFLGSGIAGTYLTIVQLLAYTTNAAESAAEHATLLFLISHASGRIGTLMLLSLFPRGDKLDKYMFSLAYLLILSGLGVLLIHVTLECIYMASVFLGLAFGCVWVTFPVLCTSRLPSDPMFASKRLGVIVTAVSTGSLSMTFITTALQPHGNCIGSDCFERLLAVNCVFSCIGLIASIKLALILLKKDVVLLEKIKIYVP